MNAYNSWNCLLNIVLLLYKSMYIAHATHNARSASPFLSQTEKSEATMTMTKNSIWFWLNFNCPYIWFTK